jgi:hypothetical protein
MELAILAKGNQLPYILVMATKVQVKVLTAPTKDSDSVLLSQLSLRFSLGGRCGLPSLDCWCGAVILYDLASPLHCR